VRTSVIVTFIGDDKPGMIEKVSNIVSRHEGNWLESRMSKLAGKFAGIIQVGIEEENAEDLTQALMDLRGKGISLLIEESEDVTAVEPTRLVQLSILGLDRPGIVHEVSQALARQFINVAEMSTDITTAAMTGELLFNAEARIEVPESVDLYRLEEQLESIGNELAVDIDLVIEPEQR
jgi:glycine cleavage system regulatory protein